jgi:hypothetical protein
MLKFDKKEKEKKRNRFTLAVSYKIKSRVSREEKKNLFFSSFYRA